jgi:hypothetical protein
VEERLAQLALEMLLGASSREARTDIGTRVRFSAQHIFLPNQEEAEGLIHGDEEYEGVITGFSDSGESRRAYAVVEVVRRLSFVVSVPDLRLISEPDPSGFEHG